MSSLVAALLVVVGGVVVVVARGVIVAISVSDSHATQRNAAQRSVLACGPKGGKKLSRLVFDSSPFPNDMTAREHRKSKDV